MSSKIMAPDMDMVTQLLETIVGMGKLLFSWQIPNCMVCVLLKTTGPRVSSGLLSEASWRRGRVMEKWSIEAPWAERGLLTQFLLF